MALTGHTSAQEPQATQSSGLMILGIVIKAFIVVVFFSKREDRHYI
jgi:hypothetical protein